MTTVSKSVQSAADYLLPYLEQFKQGTLDLKTLSPEEYVRLVYCLKHGDQALDYGKNPQLYAFKLEVLSFSPTS